MDNTDDSIITGMDCNPQWMFSFDNLKPRVHLMPPKTAASVPIQKVREGNKNNIDFKPNK